MNDIVQKLSSFRGLLDLDLPPVVLQQREGRVKLIKKTCSDLDP
jgi:hypothetical protein